MKYFNILSLGIFLLIGCKEEFTPPPNIILVMTDDQGWYDAGFNGNVSIQTQNLDKLASKGIIFDRFYAASAVCSPTRASVITGRNPLRMNIPTANAGHMKTEEITLPEILKRHGYVTGHFGKWHLGTLTREELDANRGGRSKHIPNYSIPTMHGYDEYFCTESKVPTFNPMEYPAIFQEGESKRFGWKAANDNDSTISYGTAYWTGPGEKVTGHLKGDNSTIIMDRVMPFIESAVLEDKPFFSTIWIHTPHLPVVSDRLHQNFYSEMSLQEQLYFGSITAMDEQIGRLWSKLEELNIQGETMIWFCSDNGPENNTPGSAHIFRERKRSLYEGGIRVPAFVVWEGHLEKGIRLDLPTVTSDYLPTILDILSIPYPANRPLDGQSIWGVLQGDKTERNKPIGFIYNQKISWVDQQYKLISIDNGESYELYNLIDDPGEHDNLAMDHPAIVSKMKMDAHIWLDSVENSKKGKDY